MGYEMDTDGVPHRIIKSEDASTWTRNFRSVELELRLQLPAWVELCIYANEESEAMAAHWNILFRQSPKNATFNFTHIASPPYTSTEAILNAVLLHL